MAPRQSPFVVRAKAQIGTLEVVVPLFVREPLAALVLERTQPTSSQRAWLWFNLLSLDAPLIAAIWELLISRWTGLRLHFATTAALALSVWLIYVADRLLDALRPRMNAVTPRHIFYKRHGKTIVTWAAIGVASLGMICSTLDEHIVRAGVALSAVVILYFLIVHVSPTGLRWLWPKELAVGAVFSAGTFLPAWSARGVTGEHNLWLPMVLFAGLCALNCIGIEFWEWQRYDASEPPHRSTVWAGTRLAIIATVCGLVALGCAMRSDSEMRLFYISVVASCGLLVALAKAERQMPIDLVRVLADAALLTPLPIAVFVAIG